MGSINSLPRAPATQPYVPIARPTPASETPSEPVKSDSDIATEGRKDSLLRRNRGRFGTILTSFRGFLNNASDTEAKKTLLGE